MDLLAHSVQSMLSPMKKPLIALCTVFLFALVNVVFAAEPSGGGEYGVVIEGYDWGPAVSKVILSLDEPANSVNWRDYKVMVHRSSDCSIIPPNHALETSCSGSPDSVMQSLTILGSMLAS